MKANGADASGKLVIVLYFKDGYLGVCPTVLGFAKEMSSAGHEVHIRALKDDHASAGDLPPSCRVITLLRLRGRRFLGGTKLDTLGPVLEVAWYSLQNLWQDLRLTKAQRAMRRINIGVDPPGAISAWLHFLICRRQFLYLSLELSSPQSYQRFAKAIPWLENKALQRAIAIIIQDQDRLRSLSQYHLALPARRFFLPNSPGLSASSPSVSPSENYLRKRLKIDPQKFPYIALHAGMIDDKVYSQELAQGFAAACCNFALVLHERRKRELTDPYLQHLRTLNSTNLFLSLNPVPFDQAEKVFSSATVGLAFYRPIDDNHAQMGLASGKLAFYLRHGIPVLMNSLASLVALNEKYNFGVSIQDLTRSEDFRVALDTIMAQYSVFSQNARRCFREEFNFSAKCSLIRSFLEST